MTMRAVIKSSRPAAAGFSLVLALAVGALWLRSYRQSQFLGYSTPHQFFGILSMAGLLRLERGTYPADPGWSHSSYASPRGGLWREVNAPDRRTTPLLRRLGIACSRIDYNLDGRNLRYSVYIPHWLLLILCLVFPAAESIRLLRRSHPPGHCPACGYDLRASKDRCPECGTRIAHLSLGLSPHPNPDRTPGEG